MNAFQAHEKRLDEIQKEHDEMKRYMKPPNTDRFSQHRHVALDSDPTDDELQCEMEDEGSIRDQEKIYEDNKSPKQKTNP